MKIYDFGLWFKQWSYGGKELWSTTIPPKDGFYIYYDGEFLGYQLYAFTLKIWSKKSYIIKLNRDFPRVGLDDYKIGRTLNLEDFEIVNNPLYEDF